MNETKRRVINSDSLVPVKKYKVDGLSPMSQQTSNESFDNEYSRLISAIGRETLHQFQKSKILLVGLQGLGAEVAKNLVLMGVAALDVYDPNGVEMRDISSQFFLKESDVGSKRSEATLPKLKELNDRVKISSIQGEITEAHLEKYSIVCVTACESWSRLCRWGDYCHSRNISFVVSDIVGLYGFIFVDFGSHFVVSDSNGEEVKTTYIESITNSEKSVVTVVDSKRHDLMDGDLVKFIDVKGMTEVNDRIFSVSVISPYQFSIGDTSSFGKYTFGGYVEEVKKPLELSFEPLSAFTSPDLDLSKVVLFDYGKLDRVNQYYMFLRSFLAYREKYGRLTMPWVDSDASNLVGIAHEMFSSFDVEINDELLTQMSYISSGYLSPMAAFFGGVVAQEVLKSASHRYTPLNQWFFFDSLECLNGKVSEDDASFCGTRYDAQVAVFGREHMEKLKRAKYFLVGAGAIGCEILKNWAMIGLAASPEGRIYVTDMDTIEISNLNRQFLYRPTDIGKLKSETAARVVRGMNPEMNIESFSIKVAPETSNFYKDDFWNSLTGVCNALDNLEARLYVDSQCVLYDLSLLESGTLGSKGNTQVIIPFMTESYGSSRDPPPKQTAVCLLHSFPNNIEHCLQWAREMAFEAFFVEEPKVVNDYLSSGNEFISKLSPILRGSVLQKLKSGILDRPTTFDDCIVWARNLFQDFYFNKPKQLLFNFPLDTVDASGQYFWSGAKRPPTPLNFDCENELHLDFIVTATFLRAYTCGLLESELKPNNYNDLRQSIKEKVAKVVTEPFLPLQGMKINVESENTSEVADEDLFNQWILNNLPDLSQLNLKSVPVEFEKDNDRNFHIDFIHATGNLRAVEYGIATVERLKSKFIAGNIIPAIVTTTAAVAGLVCLELYKLFQKDRKIEHFRNSFINLAISVFQQSEPIPPVVEKFMGKDITLWDKINIRIGDVTVGELLDYFKEQHNMNVDVISVGQILVYMTFGPAKKRRDQNLKKIVEEISGTPIDPSQKKFVLQIAGDDADGNSVDVMPEVIYWFS